TGFAARHALMEQTRAQAETLAAGRPPEFWPELVAQGWQAVHLPEALGGQGGDLADAACVIDAAGYALLPGPLLPTVIAGAVAATAEPGPAVSALLRDIAAGSTAVVVLPEAGRLCATAVDAGWSLNGSVGPDIGLAGADRIVVATRTHDDETIWMILDGNASGVHVTA